MYARGTNTIWVSDEESIAGPAKDGVTALGAHSGDPRPHDTRRTTLQSCLGKHAQSGRSSDRSESEERSRGLTAAGHT
ncbi:hypothetical protein SCP_0600080 [Sparassis crispa]|uniref:Uncharacterized protein n=1 Tax=Sparassis crispa TaxID=139825 RepID=A0A401GP63_9APHY|nr:hypothetical protein SCP_0600080 [Sparassis crispa]GBE84031.1 hypothetical protein SCP_0600080 [Sparassis crispa]